MNNLSGECKPFYNYLLYLITVWCLYKTQISSTLLFLGINIVRGGTPGVLGPVLGSLVQETWTWWSQFLAGP